MKVNGIKIHWLHKRFSICKFPPIQRPLYLGFFFPFFLFFNKMDLKKKNDESIIIKLVCLISFIPRMD